MNSARIHLTDKGWMIDTPVGLTFGQLQKAIDFHKKVQRERIRFMRGDQKVIGEQALKILSPFTIQQNIIPNEYNEKIIQGGN